ncbi:phospholipase A2-like [Grus japonensis]|uniref:Phospholipase A2 n=1 Tax=Grus japonensis TaxID=30415 RepID=A0ABC9VY67_GRUJA
MGSCLLLVLMLLQAVWKGALGKSHSLHTRGIIELAGAISCGTGRSPLAYIGYGCYCGLGGQGWPKDKTDWCCHRHDCCYDKAEKEGCSPKAQRYEWACERNAVRCALETHASEVHSKAQCRNDIFHLLRKGDYTGQGADIARVTSAIEKYEIKPTGDLIRRMTKPLQEGTVFLPC